MRCSSYLWGPRPWIPRPHTSLRVLAPFRASSTAANATRLDLLAIDKKWQERWQSNPLRSIPGQQKEKCYVLSMFPYPSGTLHMGHLRVYTITDVIARYKRMKGYDVLYPMGWDAFGLPAENAAMERRVDPMVWTKQNIVKMKEQLQMMNGGFDWSRELMTCDPSFYKHTQRLFLMLHERGLAYQDHAVVNYDPIDRTVLANEQVDSNGFSWRSGAKVEQRQLKQWFLRITEYKEALLKDLEFLGEGGKWPERVLAMQRNWLGRSQGTQIKFRLLGQGIEDETTEVFTTRPDTLFGVQYLALSTTHPLVMRLAKHDRQLQAFLDRAPALPPDSKAGHELFGVGAINPLSYLQGSPLQVAKTIPVYVAPYVIGGYGTGAVMGVPGHDTRDYAFWSQNSPTSPILSVIDAPADSMDNAKSPANSNAFTEHGTLNKRCGQYQGLSSAEGSERIFQDLATNGEHARMVETWKLRDWLISRQSCGTVPVPTEDLPVELPHIASNWFAEKRGNPLESAEEWLNTTCPKCGGSAKRETDTMDTFVDSSWYFMRFPDSQNPKKPFNTDIANAMLPVDIYIGGIEHAILHLLYARFISKFVASTSLWPAGRSSELRGEPFRRLISQGMVHGKTFSDPQTGRFLKSEEVDLSDAQNPKIVGSNERPNESFEKMSKSKHNGVDPSSFIIKYGADVTRAHILFQAPVSEVLEWEEERISGIQRWFHRLWRVVTQVNELCLLQNKELLDSFPISAKPDMPISKLSKAEQRLMLDTQSILGSINDSLSTTYALNTVISDLIKLTNSLSAAIVQDSASDSSSTKSAEGRISPMLLYHTANILIRLLAPVAPAFAEESWAHLHASSATPTMVSSVFTQPFPELLDAKSINDLSRLQKQPCAIQENGKLRLTIDLDRMPNELAKDVTAGHDWILDAIKKSEQGSAWLARKDAEGKVWKKTIVVGMGKVVNFVG